VFPIFPDPASDRDAEISLFTSSFSPASVVGMAGDVARYESALRLAPKATVAYRMMARAGGRAAPLDAATPIRPGLTIRRACPGDLCALLPLQEAYEREEVLTSMHEFNPAACKASLARALERQLVFAAEEAGVIIGKAGTNARGFAVDQIGGVYTLPARRGRGIANALMAALLSEISFQGRSPALFVKLTNGAARALYRGLGFEDIGDYRADYFEA
jgi:predicted GNAT family acetyltransferase